MSLKRDIPKIKRNGQTNITQKRYVDRYDANERRDGTAAHILHADLYLPETGTGEGEYPLVGIRDKDPREEHLLCVDLTGG